MAKSPTPPGDLDPFRESMKIFSDMRFGAMPDLEGLAAAQRRNLEALSAANRVALEGAQAVAKRHMEIMQQSMAEMTDAMRSVTEQGDPKEKAARQAEILKATYERAVSNIRELADLIQKSNGEALNLLNRRFTEAMDEVKSIMSNKG
ncbi:Phasing family protein [Roseomonas mucosa]|jgi:phasin family protein|uniref:Phasin n=1 Tax=Roseomonas mucosa TaxID=207340 RepID=A0A1S8D2E8_9PROT|nr:MULTISPECIES: phasin family protein [Roseomonas]MDT8264099.1 phasin family protein [Roseomonas sp. DSM 102946]ATR22701.1 phasin [Roseomonas sp. FDAARGOS_362]AWV24282.1 Phasing family protein [Roseomonas mucosa]MCG7352074.1 phasin family protein [Roseomonas mucosa]MCG7357883.1 phasin family protein [Roseomonas mucosa]